MKRIVDVFSGRQIAKLALLLLLGAVPYLGSFSVPFQYDDRHTVLENQAVRELDLGGILATARPLSYLSLGVDFRFWGHAPAGYHLSNLLLHLVNGVAAWRLLGLLGAGRAAWWVALAFLVHPIQTESVVYLSSRSELLAASFLLAGGVLFLGGKARGAGWLQAVFCLAAAASKENGAVYPFWILFLDLAARRGSAVRWKTHAASFGALAAVSAALAYWKGDLYLLQVIRAAGGWQAPLGYLLAQLQAIPRYLELLFLPVGQNLNHWIPWAFPEGGLDPSRPWSLRAAATTLWAWWDVPGAWGALRLAVYLGILRALAGSWRSWGTGVGWFAIAILPTSSLVPLLDPIQEHRVYLAGVGVLWIAAVALARPGFKAWPVGKSALRVAAVSVIACWMALAWVRNEAWQRPDLLWAGSARAAPLHPRPHLNLGACWSMAGRWAGAAKEYRAALAAEYSDERTLFTLRNLFENSVQRQDWREADLALLLLRDRSKGDPERILAAWGGGAVDGFDVPLCLRFQGGPPMQEAVLGWALSILERSVQVRTHPRVAGNIGNLEWMRGRPEPAARWYGEALRLHRTCASPDAGFEADLRLSLARALIVLGRRDEARRALLEASAEVRADPRLRQILGDLGASGE